VKTSLVLFSAVTYHYSQTKMYKGNKFFVSTTTTFITTILTTSFDYKQSLSDKPLQNTRK